MRVVRNTSGAITITRVDVGTSAPTTFEQRERVYDSWVRTMRDIRALPEHSCDGQCSGHLERTFAGIRAFVSCDVCSERVQDRETVSPLYSTEGPR